MIGQKALIVSSTSTRESLIGVFKCPSIAEQNVLVVSACPLISKGFRSVMLLHAIDGFGSIKLRSMIEQKALIVSIAPTEASRCID